VRKIVIAGNWKMYKTQGETLDFLRHFLGHLTETPDGREIVLCAPFTALGALSKSLHGARVKVGAQNIHWMPEGAFTGEISGDMLRELGVRYVVVGHSERRQYFSDTDETVNLQIAGSPRVWTHPYFVRG
jgi:triosephosphate isomerase